MGGSWNGLLGLEKERSKKEGKERKKRRTWQAITRITREKQRDRETSLRFSSLKSIIRDSDSLCFLHIPTQVHPQNCCFWLAFGLVIVRMIARILAALADSMDIPVAAGGSVLGTIKIAVMPIAKVFTMCFLGLLMASKYVNILPPSGRKLLNGVILQASSHFFFYFISKNANFETVSFSYSWSSRFCFPA